MADFATALRGRLIAAPAVSAVTTKIFWGIVPQNTPLPYVRMQVVSDPRPQHLQGYDGARVTRVQADGFAMTYGEARQLSEAIIAAVAAPATFGGVQFGRTSAEGPQDLGEDVPGIGYVHRMSLDLLTEHKMA